MTYLTTYTVTLPPPTGIWREYYAFLRLLPELLETHQGKHVAVCDERVVSAGDDKDEVTLEAKRQCGDVIVYVAIVTDPPVRLIRISHYRTISQDIPDAPGMSAPP